MTTPQDMPPETESGADGAPDDPPAGIIYTFFTRLVAWVAFVTCFAMLVGLVIFLGLGLYRGIIWLWPGGPLG